MVFMEDSRRAAELARETGLDAGLHLNFTLPFSASGIPSQLRERQRKLANFLVLHSLAQIAYHPGLANSFDYVVKAQLAEFSSLYGAPPERIDGHHHMHLCANIVFAELLPPGTLVRRNFSFLPGEKSLLNRLYRKSIDRKLAKRHRMVDYLFSLPPLEPPERMDRIRSLARESVVEVETHPVNPEEYAFLTGGGVVTWSEETPIAGSFTASSIKNGIKGKE